MNWWSYVTRIAGTDNGKDIAKKVGVDQSTVSRWKTTGVPGKAENVAKLARAYNKPVLEAFVAAEFLSPAEAKVRPAPEPDFTQLTNDELLELVRARMREDVMGNAEHPAAIAKQDVTLAAEEDLSMTIDEESEALAEDIP